MTAHVAHLVAQAHLRAAPVGSHFESRPGVRLDREATAGQQLERLLQSKRPGDGMPLLTHCGQLTTMSLSVTEACTPRGPSHRALPACLDPSGCNAEPPLCGK